MSQELVELCDSDFKRYMEMKDRAEKAEVEVKRWNELYTYEVAGRFNASERAGKAEAHVKQLREALESVMKNGLAQNWGKERDRIVNMAKQALENTKDGE